jgi:hypothetical protein
MGIPVCSAAAQAAAEAGVVRDAKRGTPLECLHVALLDSTGKAIGHTVTDAQGQFTLDAPRPGRYRVQFEIYAWAPLAGPLDTLADGDFRQRAYPVSFVELLADSTAAPDSVTERFARDSNWRHESVAFRSRAARDARLHKFLRAREADGAWKSRRLTTKNLQVRYPPEMFARGVQGDVIGEIIVDSTGAMRPGYWTTVVATRREFEDAVREVLPTLTWTPAHIGERPVCELTREHVLFTLDFSDPGLHRGSIMFLEE